MTDLRRQSYKRNLVLNSSVVCYFKWDLHFLFCCDLNLSKQPQGIYDSFCVLKRLISFIGLPSDVVTQPMLFKSNTLLKKKFQRWKIVLNIKHSNLLFFWFVKKFFFIREKLLHPRLQQSLFYTRREITVRLRGAKNEWKMCFEFVFINREFKKSWTHCD